MRPARKANRARGSNAAGFVYSHKVQEMQKGEWLIFVFSPKVQEKQEEKQEEEWSTSIVSHKEQEKQESGICCWFCV